MNFDCPYHDCASTELTKLEGTDYAICSECDRTAVSCVQSGCCGWNRPFIRYCQRCGKPASRRFWNKPPRARKAVSERSKVDDVFLIGRHASLSESAQCLMLFLQGILVIQFDDGNVFGLFPFRSGENAVVFHFVLETDGAPLFPPVVADDVLIFASPKRVWRLPLIRMWSHSQTWGDSSTTLQIYEAPSDLELVSRPTILSADHSQVTLFVLLKGSGDQVRWVWLRASDAADRPVHQEARLGNIHGDRFFCQPISDRLVAIVTTEGHWLLRNAGSNSDGVWHDHDCECRQTLATPISWGLVFEHPSAFLNGSYQNGEDRTRYLRAYFVGDVGRSVRERRLWHYQDLPLSNSNAVALPDVAARSDGVRPVDEVVTNVTEAGPVIELLAVSDKELFLCNRIGSVTNCGLNFGDIAFRDVQVLGNRALLIWDDENTTSSTFGMVEVDRGKANLSLTKTMELLRCMPVVTGPHLFAITGEGRDCRVVCHRDVFGYREVNS